MAPIESTASLALSQPHCVKRPAHFTTLQLTIMGAAGAASFCLTFLKLPVPFAPFLKYDPSDVPPILCALAMGPEAGFLVVLSRIVLRMMTSAADPIGMAMNLAASGSFVLVAGAMGRFAIERGAQVRALLAATAVMTAVMIPVNYWVLQVTNYVPAGEVASTLATAITPFNLCKGVTNSLIVMALFKRLRPGMRV